VRAIEQRVTRIERAIARRIERRVVRPLERGVNWRKQRVHMLHVGKTAGTAVKDALTSPQAGVGRYEIVAHEHPTHLPEIPKGEKVFFVVRDPVDRFVSGFNSRLRQGRPRHDWPWTPAEEIAFEQFRTADMLGRALSSEDVQVRAQAFTAMISIRHVRDSYWRWFGSREYLDTRLDDLLLILWMPDLAVTFPQLRDLLGLPSSIQLPSDDLRSHRSPGTVDRTLSAVSRRNLEMWFGRDFAFIDYCAQLDCFAGPSRKSVDVSPPGSDLGETAPASHLADIGDSAV
jgi:hypothetical protein